MVVISLIAIIGGVLSYNLKGSLEKGKAFKTEQSIKRITEILTLTEDDENVSREKLSQDPLKYIKAYGIVYLLKKKIISEENKKILTIQ